MAGVVSHAQQTPRKQRPAGTRGRCGFSLIETMIALAILLIVMSALFSPFVIAIAQNESQGNVATRATELTQDKMEQLLALTFNDANLGGAMAASSTVGSVPPAAAVTSYVDYLDPTGATTTSAAKFFTRQWSISTDASATLKTITVVVTAKNAVADIGVAPSTTLVCYKSSGL